MVAMSILTLVPLVSTSHVAAGSNPLPETRAAFTCALADALHLAPKPVADSPFTDLGSTSTACQEEISAAYAAGWISGTGPHSFGPQASLTREQVAKIEINALGLSQAAGALLAYRPFFVDSGTIGAWAWGDVDEAHKVGILNGFTNGTFGPAVTFTPAQAADAIRQVLGYEQGKRPSTTFLQPAHVPAVTLDNAVYAIGVTFDPNPPPVTVDPLNNAADTRVSWLWDAVQKGWLPRTTTTVSTKISRAELLSVVVAALGDSDAATALANAPSPYRDDALIPAQYRGAVDEAAKLDLLPVGPNGLLGPNVPATAFDVDTVLQRALAVQGKAPWAASPDMVGHAAFVYGLTLAAGQMPYILKTDRTVSTIGDVPDGTPGIYYIEQAEEQDWVQGIVAYPGSYQWVGNTSLALGAALQPDQPISLAQALQLADIATESAMYPADPLGASPKGPQYARMLAQGLQSEKLPFANAASMAPDERGFVAEALTLGLLAPSSGALQFDAPLTPQASAALLSRVQAQVLSRIEHPHAPGVPAYIGTTTVEPVATNCSACSAFMALPFDRQGYETNATIVANASPGVSVKDVTVGPVTKGNVTTYPALSGTSVELSTTGSELATITLRSGTATASVQVPVAQQPLQVVVRAVSPSIQPGATTSLRAYLKDATGKVYPVNADWRVVAPSYTVGNPPQFQWGSLSDWGPSASTTFLASGTPGQGQVDAVLPFGATGTAPPTGSAQVDILSDVKTLKMSVVDTTSGSSSIAQVGDTIDVRVQAFDANGNPALSPDVVNLWNGGFEALQDGAATWTERATSAQTMTFAVSDLSQPAVKGVQAQMPVVVELRPGPETGVALFDQNGQPAAPPPEGGNPTPVWLRPIDAKGMPTSVSASSPQTVDLLTLATAFSETTGGSPITTVSLPPGSTGVELYLTTTATVGQPVALPALAPIKISSPEDGQTVAIGQNYAVFYTVVDANGNPIHGAPVTFTMTTPTGTDSDQNQDPMFKLSPTSGLTGTDGQVSADLDGPSTTADSDFSTQVSASVEGFASSQPITFTW